MIRMNENFKRLQGSYLFSEVSKRVKAYQDKNPGKKLIRLGIGDVTRPLTPAVISGLEKGVREMGKAETFKGYSPDSGYEFLREAIAKSDFASRGVTIGPDEIFISTGAKEETANIQELFAADVKIAVPDPVYPVYVDSNVMAGRSGDFVNGRYSNYCYLDCTAENDFTPELPKQPVDLIYLCFPNNPTGKTLKREELKKWVDYAVKNRALILYDAAYEAFIRDDSPHSIFEIDGAKEVAIEFRSLSKTAGFTGTRCAYTIIPKEARAYDAEGKAVSLNPLWARRQSTKFNGVAYLIQKGAAAVFTEKGKKEAREVVDYYLDNAKIIASGIKALGLKYSGGDNSPYIWFKTPGKISSWDFFDLMLDQQQVVGTPGSGFGRCGEGYFRLTSFGKKEDVKEAVERMKKLKI
jgi:LL-diaminopimelate aminotransferase